MTDSQLTGDSGDAAEPQAGGAERRKLTIRLGDAQTRADVAPVLDGIGQHLEHVVIDASDPIGHSASSAIFEALKALPGSARPILELHADRLSSAEDALARLEDMRPDRIVVRWSPEWREVVRAARAVLSDHESSSIGLSFKVEADNWFEIVEVCREADELEIRVDLSASRDDAGSIAGLPLVEQRFLAGHIADLWPLMTGDDRPASLDGSAHQQLVAELRAGIRERGESARYRRPATVLRGRGNRLSWPPFDHSALQEPAQAAPLLRRLLGLRASPSVTAWVRRITRQTKSLSAIGEHAWLRVVLQSVACDGRDPLATDVLRDLYADHDRRQALLERETKFAQSISIESWLGYYRNYLGLDRYAPRRPPFAIKPRRKRSRAKPDVTVIVPSYRHENYIEQTVQSVLAQSYGNFELRVVDDRSPDETVARAEAVEDPRIEVSVNAKNVGLGNSVLAALRSCDTPYVALLNSDDLFHPDRLRACRDALRDNPRAQVVATDLYLIDGDGGGITQANVGRLRDGSQIFEWVSWFGSSRPKGTAREDLFGALLAGNFLATSSNLFCRTDFLRSQADALRRLKFCLDWQVFLEAARTDALVYLPRKLAAYRLHAANTVWFREGRRWAYYLEVNRVVAKALAAVSGERNKGRRAAVRRRLLELAVGRALENAEVDGMGLFLNDVLGGVELDRLAESDGEAQALVEALNERAERVSRIGYAVRDHLTDEQGFTDLARLPSLEVADVLSDLRNEELGTMRGRARWLEQTLEKQLELRRRLEAERRSLQERIAETTTRLDETIAERDAARAVHEMAARQVGSAAQAKRQLEELEQKHRTLSEQHDQIKVERGRLESQLETVTRARDELDDECKHLREGHNRLCLELNRIGEELDEERQHFTTERESMLEQQRKLRRHLSTMSETLASTRAAWREEIETIYRSREWRTGRLLWQKVPLMRKATRLAGRIKRRISDAAERRALRRRAHAATHRTLIVAASTPQFPLYSHTFVYQELIAMREGLGADVQLLYSRDGRADGLPEPFRYLNQHKTRIIPSRDIAERDFTYFRKKLPERVESLLTALEKHSSLTRSEIVDSHDFLPAFTFARRIEALSPDYIHTYFFYGESLYGLVSKWLLDVPRGVSAYADHMLDDWPLKVVPLHLETADIVVATSSRIADELRSLGGEDLAPKIVVKPNGVDGARFPFRERMQIENRTLELISVSRIEPKKGLCELVEAVARLRERGRPVRVHVVGTVTPETPVNLAYREAIERELEDHGVIDAFVFHGFKPTKGLLPLLLSAHAFVAPYVETERGDKDGIPTSVLEAMASGLPVIATDAGSLREVITDGVEGFIVPQKDPSALADAIDELYASTERLRELGRNARARFDRDFDTHVTEARLHEQIRDLLG